MRTKMVTFLAVLALVAVFMLPAAHANLVLNGSFENIAGTYIDGGSGFMTVSAGDSTTITNWKVTTNTIDWIGTYWDPSVGDYSLDMTGTDGHGTIASTSFATTAGLVYKVTFDMSGNFVQDATNRDLIVSEGAESATYTFLKTGTWSQTNMEWAPKEFYFTADGALSTLIFAADTTDPNTLCGPAIDNVQVNVVPIPGALVLLGAGLVRLVGYSRRKRALA